MVIDNFSFGSSSSLLQALKVESKRIKTSGGLFFIVKSFCLKRNRHKINKLFFIVVSLKQL